MTAKPASSPVTPAGLHPRNLHQGRYNLAELTKATPGLKPFLKTNPRGEDTIDFSNEQAVLCLNKSLLAHFYKVTQWQIPAGYLCPPIPGRADYIHYLADLLAKSHHSKDLKPPMGSAIKVLDIGAGANCIYPIIGAQSYGWQFTASDIDPVSVKAARMIVNSNTCLKNSINVLQQPDSRRIFKGIIKEQDRFDATVCNPPFHASMAEANAGSERKWKNLNKDKNIAAASPKLNFGGQKAELWCEGGEIQFLKQMIIESAEFATQVCWFTSLVSKGDNVQPLKRQLKKKGAKQIQVIKMTQGQKISRVLAWSFLTQDEQVQWASEINKASITLAR
ncbi:23S rRNA (adenine(1618)-N(6))-methyltransferase RlmF [Endozoicomonas sp.]|uniref:23S rRNA (adenine(1618)-N(6))-methyltransferase RlmF n=1 Tax=Endozoicomonas sp. TaxID=1892382 RepID=UPI002886FA68|nr:23S rRNA (adenine(1618)-N(6))-methyltransferase RlmF [Endozoicomonas sp.]